MVSLVGSGVPREREQLSPYVNILVLSIAPPPLCKGGLVHSRTIPISAPPRLPLDMSDISPIICFISRPRFYDFLGTNTLISGPPLHPISRTSDHNSVYGPFPVFTQEKHQLYDSVIPPARPAKSSVLNFPLLRVGTDPPGVSVNTATDYSLDLPNNSPHFSAGGARHWWCEDCLVYRMEMPASSEEIWFEGILLHMSQIERTFLRVKFAGIGDGLDQISGRVVHRCIPVSRKPATRAVPEKVDFLSVAFICRWVKGDDSEVRPILETKIKAEAESDLGS
ncbi:hypothetical protein FB451DRAFT_1192369 [Mycena latifolia]|nr:hypothetical protein FB451DRAFT_1192369 [Mycena latifolia]